MSSAAQITIEGFTLLLVGIGLLILNQLLMNFIFSKSPKSKFISMWRARIGPDDETIAPKFPLKIYSIMMLIGVFFLTVIKFVLFRGQAHVI